MDDRLNLIRKFCNTEGVRLKNDAKDLLIKILSDPDKYNGFTSELYEERNSGKDHNGRWESYTTYQYHINIGSMLSIDEDYSNECDGYEQKECHHVTDVKRIIEILKKIWHEL